MSVHREARVGFDRAADAYERGRPDYDPGAIAWLAGELGLGPGRVVLDVGAGTGKLTRALLASGAEVVAVEPVPGMRAVLERTAPAARALDGTAEALPVAAASLDAIVAGQAFHWFDAPRALAEFDRALRPGGRLALVWNRRRAEQPLHREIESIIAPYRRRTPSHASGRWRDSMDATELFAAAAERELPVDQVLEIEGFVDRVLSISFVAALDRRGRAEVERRLRELVDPGAGQVVLGYLCELFVYDRVSR
jgi:SAM-dependent methyltransferase